MPTYEYECLKCKKTFEWFQSMKDNPLKTCPKTACKQSVWGKGKVKRTLSAGAGFIFKGSGFYITDYRSEGYKKAAKSETESGSKNSSSSDSSSVSTKSNDKNKKQKPTSNNTAKN